MAGSPNANERGRNTWVDSPCIIATPGPQQRQDLANPKKPQRSESGADCEQHPLRRSINRGRAAVKPSRDSHELVRLETEAPPGMGEAVAHGELRVPHPVGPVHRLQEPVSKTEAFEALRGDALLGEHQLQLVAAPEHELGSGLGADAHPIDTGWRQQGAVRLDRDFEPRPTQGRGEGLVELQQGLAARAYDEAGGARRSRGGPGGGARVRNGSGWARRRGPATGP